MTESIRVRSIAFVGPTIALIVALSAPAAAQVTTLVSVNSAGIQGNDASIEPSISPDGRYVAFTSYAAALVAGDTNGLRDVFVHDRSTGSTVRASVDSNGVQGNAESSNPAISADGRWVAFQSLASNLVPGDTNAIYDIFVHDVVTGTTEKVSVDSGGAQTNGVSYGPSISEDGRWIGFYSHASNLVPGDTNGTWDVFVHDRQTGNTVRASVDSSGAQGNGDSLYSCLSGNGRFLAFSSDASNLVAGDTNGFFDVFLRDLQAGSTELVSVSTSGTQGTNLSQAPFPSADGRFVLFSSDAPNLAAGDTNNMKDAFLRDRQLGTTEIVSLGSGGGLGNNYSVGTSLSPDGRFVAFYSLASNLVSGDTNPNTDVFLRDRLNGTTEMMDASTAGVQSNSTANLPRVTADGRFVAFQCYGSNLVTGDGNGQYDVFLRDRLASGFTSLCDAGSNGVIACPCANPPGAPGSGCDNSSGTGGAVLSASGVAYLSTDTLQFASSGEKPNALSVFSQGSALLGSGAVFGMGVRCAGGNLKRLYVKTAVGGACSAPAGGDLSVHARAALLGDTILPGTSRYYYVYYRDPVVLGGCPAGSTFNTTQTGRVDWSM